MTQPSSVLHGQGFHFKDLTKDPFMVFMFVLMDKAMV